MPPWTSEDLREWAREQVGSGELLILAHREPFSHARGVDGSVLVSHSTSGLVAALEPLLRACGGVWIAHGSVAAGAADLQQHDALTVPPEEPSYRLRRVWLDAEELQGYYDNFANQGLWPLCHRVHVRPLFRPDDFNSYWNINGRFVDAVCEEAATDTPIVLVQDYHFALAPQMIRERLPRSTIATFWHIPWPSGESFEICPWGRHLIEGLLGSDVIGLQTPADCRNFLDTVGRSLEAHIDRERGEVTYAGSHTTVRTYPSSIEWPDRVAAASPPIEVCQREVRESLGVAPGVRLAVGVGRLDYTKGIEEAFAGLERLLECYPEYRGALSFVQMAEPSRTRLQAYRDLHARIKGAAERVNRRFGRDGCRPAILLDRHAEPAEVYRLLRAADVCYVASLHDGMNLVAKQFVGARDDLAGALVLSQFAGAARELSEALIVNPYDIDEAAHALVRALAMPPDEQRCRMSRMRATVAEDNAYKWAARILADVSRVRGQAEIEPRRLSGEEFMTT